MRKGWEYKKLPEISENLDSLRKPVTKKNRTAGIYPYYGASGIVDYVDDYLFDEDLLCISEDGANLLMRTYPIAFPISGKVWVNNHAHVLRFKDIATQKYVEYFFAGFKLDDYITGAAQPKLTQKALNNITIKIPISLSEQQSIVDYLDSAFAKIDAMKANAEKALNEAKDLFQASLKEMFEPKEGWEEKKLVNEFSLKSGENLSTKKQIKGMYPVYGGNGITGYHNKYNLSGDQILIGRVGALCGNVHYTKENIWVTDNAFVVNNISSSWNMLFLSYELEYIDLNQYASQTAQPVISNKSMKDVSIFLPPLSEQQSIVTALDSLKSKVDCLQTNYAKISQECDALKQAILRQVFE